MGAGSQAALQLIIDLKGDGEAAKKLHGLGQEGSFLSNSLSFATGGAILSGIQGIAGGVTDFFKSSIAESQGWNDAMAQTDAVLKSTGGSAGVTKEQVEGLAASLSGASGLSKFADDAVASGENLLLTFTGIGKDVFPQATQTMLDMAQAMGGDMKGTAIQLGKALNDPAQGLSALTRVGVTFTQQQEDQIKAMVKAGDTAGAQKVMLAELSREFGGSAKAAADAAGPMFTLGEKFNDIKQTVGDALLPVVNQLAGAFSQLLTGATQFLEGALTNLGPTLQSIGTTMQGLITQAQPFIDFVGANLQPILAGLAAMILAVVVPAFVTWAAVAIPAAAATVAGLVALAAPLIAVGVAVAALKIAWDNNFLGMRDTLMPIIDAVVGGLSRFWTEVQPQLIAAWNAISSTVVTAWNTLAPLVINGLNTLKTAWDSNWGGIRTILESVWGIISGTVSTAWTLVSGIVKTGLQILSGDWSGAWTTIKTTLSSAWSSMQTILSSAVTLVGTTVTNFLPTLISKLAEWAGKFVGWIGTDVIPKLPTALGTILTTIGTWITGAVTWAVTNLVQVGEAIINGVIAGLRAAGDAIRTFLLGLITGAVDAVKNFFGIHSPSEYTAQYIGIPLGEGIIVGLERSLRDLTPVMIGGIQDSLRQASSVLGIGAGLRGSDYLGGVGGPSGGGGFLPSGALRSFGGDNYNISLVVNAAPGADGHAIGTQILSTLSQGLYGRSAGRNRPAAAAVRGWSG